MLFFHFEIPFEISSHIFRNVVSSITVTSASWAFFDLAPWLLADD